jgi:hypothetical protein
VLLLLMLGFSQAAISQDQSPNIYLEVTGGGTALGVQAGLDTDSCTTAEKGSDNAGARGYMCITHGRRANINMHLPPSFACGTEDGYRWQISQVVLGGEGQNNKPENSPWGGLSSGAASDFSADQTTGVVNISPPGGGHVVNFRNENEHEFVLWYRVDAECRRGDSVYGDPISLDPRSRNGGGG